jgi:hypothetical protein
LHFDPVPACSGGAIHPSFWLAVSILSAIAASSAAWLVLGMRRPHRDVLIVVTLILVAASPLWVPGSEPVYRLPAILVVIAMLVKLYDLHVSGTRPPFSEFLPFLFNGFLIVHRRRHAVPRPSREQDFHTLAWAVAKLAITVSLCVWAFRSRWDELPFLLEHIAKAGTVFMAAEHASTAGAALWRLRGGTARDFMDAPLLAVTPADFWRRYNRPVTQFLHEDVFLPCGGRHAPLRATFATFVVSALVHEYVFGIIIGRVQGYQTVFFLAQGCAAVATLRLRPHGAMKWVARAATLSFNLLTSVFFFASWDQFLPFYSRPLPWPLAGW